MIITTGKKPEKVIEERVNKEIVQETDTYKYLQVPRNGNQWIRKLERSYTRIK